MVKEETDNTTPSSISAATKPMRKKESVKKTKEDVDLIKLALHRSRYFTCLDEDQIERFIEVAELRTFKPEELVIQQGAASSFSTKSIYNTYPGEEGITVILENDNNGTDGVDDVDEEIARNQAAAAAVVESQQQLNFNSSINKIEKESGEEEDNRAIFAIRSGSAEVWKNRTNTKCFGPSDIFGDAAVLFNQDYDITVVAANKQPLECWVVPTKEFHEYVLRSDNMNQLFHAYARHQTEDGEPYMTMDDFVNSCRQQMSNVAGTVTTTGEDGDEFHIRVKNTYSLLRKNTGYQQIKFPDYCIFHLIMSRPDPEVDIAMLVR
jgi:CRP-like cAMP-binding protein